MGMSPLELKDVRFPEGQFPEIAIWDMGNAGKNYIIQVLTRNGLDQLKYTSSSDRSITARSFRLSNLPLMVAVKATTANTRRGEIYVHVTLRFGGVHAIHLMSGYVSMFRGLCWPPGVFEDALEGPGLLRSITGTDPAAGAEFSETVPTNARWRLAGVRVDFVTDATVATRRVILLIDDGTNELHRIPASPTQVESLTCKYSFSPTGLDAANRNNAILCFLPHPLFLFQGWRIRSTTVNLQAGDNYGAPQMLVEEWMED